MKFSQFVIVILSVFLIAGCVSYDRVFSDYETDVDFSAYSTYKVIDHNDGLAIGGNPINNQRIERAIEREMDALGYTRSSDADLVVSSYVKVREVEGPLFYYDFYWGWGGIRYADAPNYEEGILIIDIIDDKRNRVVWHGKTSGRWHHKSAKFEEKMNFVVESMFEKFREDSGLIKTYAYH